MPIPTIGGVPIRWRGAKKAYRLVKHGPHIGTAQYLGRQVWYADKSKPGGNYANPKRKVR